VQVVLDHHDRVAQTEGDRDPRSGLSAARPPSPAPPARPPAAGGCWAMSRRACPVYGGIIRRNPMTARSGPDSPYRVTVNVNETVRLRAVAPDPELAVIVTG
jgi:hypothetical protein